jgi:chloramphenicol-sensitive protein RarD
MKKGILTGITAYVLWGILPLYWKYIEHIPAVEIIGHRIVWSFFFMLIVVLVRQQGQSILDTYKNRKSTLALLSSAFLLGVNWLVYIWAVNSGHIVDASLGYFINPLVNVIFGVVILKERLRFWQWVSVGMAFAGVLYLTFRLGSVPWIGLVLAATFGSYGLIRKRAVTRSITGFTIETGFMFIPAVAYLVGQEIAGRGSFGHGSLPDMIFLVTTGAVTALPLLLFGTTVRLVTLTTLGFMQYIAPTLQFLIGIFVFTEEFAFGKLIGYVIIWIALAVFSIEGALFRQVKKSG